MIIRAVRPGDIDAVVEFSVRAWRPVFESFMEIMGPDIFPRVYPDWRADQARAVAEACRVLPAGHRPGWACQAASHTRRRRIPDITVVITVTGCAKAMITVAWCARCGDRRALRDN